MKHITDDVRIREIKELSPPAHILREFPTTDAAAETTYEARQALHRVLHGADDRLVVVIGPCSIHDYDAAMEYARRLHEVSPRFADDLLIVMRVYFEKPRTTVGWKGLINDPRMDGSFRINEGLRLARKLLWEINELGLPCGTEFLDTITPQYTADLISWGAIGARTTESQVHRELASGLSCPVGFKNGTDGNIRIAVDAIKAGQPAPFPVGDQGRPFGHRVDQRQRGLPRHPARRQGAQLRRGGGRCGLLRTGQVRPRLARDDRFLARQQQQAVQEAARRGARCRRPDGGGEDRIFGVMIESHLKEGRQDLKPGKPLEYGVSVTDACIGWEDSLAVLEILAEASRSRRVALADK
jgi:3-deoxy-7-phosphoheptulonate synthase